MSEKRIQVIHTHRYVMAYAIPAAIMAGVKVRIHTVHSLADKEQNFIHRLISKLFFKKLHVLPVAISPEVKKTIVQEYKLAMDDVPIIYNGIDLTKCHPKTNYNPSIPFRFLHIGRLIPLKQQEIIIRAVSYLNSQGFSCQVSFVGDGAMKHKYQTLVEELAIGGFVTFCGPQSDVYPFIKEADAFLLPSIYEGMPITLIEAMGSGLPIIASNVGGIPDMISNNEEGLLITPDLHSLVNAMITLMRDQDLRCRLGNNAKERAESFSALLMAKQYAELYENRLFFDHNCLS